MNIQPDISADNNVHWNSELAGDAGSLQPWLLESGLLTARVQRHCSNSFRLQVLTTDDAGAGWLKQHADWAPCAGDRREIVMWCDDIPGLYAETVIPAATAAAQPWLRTLGTQPLGERLQLMQDVSRGNFEFARIPCNHLVPDSWCANGVSELWARRSSFRFASGDELWVIEVFLKAIHGDSN